MGGAGSGRWLRTGTKDTTSSRLRLDVQQLKDHTRFDVGTTGQISWGNRLLSFELKADSLLLGTFPLLDNVTVAAKPYEIMFERTACHFGGTRNWFRCPYCEGRFGTLYLEDRNFVCRGCCNLAYPSQLQSRASRLITKAHKIRHSLGASGNVTALITVKPKGMHWRTFFLALLELREAVKAVNEAVMDELYPNKNPLTGTSWRDEL
jgi:hypothetical protein